MCVCEVSAVPHRRDVVCTCSPVSWIEPGLDQNVCPVGFILQVYLGQTGSPKPELPVSLSRLSALWQRKSLISLRPRSCTEPRQGHCDPYNWEKSRI